LRQQKKQVAFRILTSLDRGWLNLNPGANRSISNSHALNCRGKFDGPRRERLAGNLAAIRLAHNPT
jgi:hypothetical protein